jgi:hypothetical protein
MAHTRQAGGSIMPLGAMGPSQPTTLALTQGAIESQANQAFQKKHPKFNFDGAVGGAVSGGLVGAAVGAGIGFLVGGPIGAVIGGVVGGAVGAVLGWLKGSKKDSFGEGLLAGIIPGLVGGVIGGMAAMVVSALAGGLTALGAAALKATIWGAVIGAVVGGGLAVIQGERDPLRIAQAAFQGAVIGAIAGFVTALCEPLLGLAVEAVPCWAAWGVGILGQATVFAVGDAAGQFAAMTFGWQEDFNYTQLALSAGMGALVGAVRFSPLMRQFCFPAGTLVATQRGLRPIEEIRETDQVWAFDHWSNRWELRPVTKAYHGPYQGVMVSVGVAESTIEATAGHPFWVLEGQGLEDRPQREGLPQVPSGSVVPGRWVEAEDLQVGDILLLRNRGPQAVTQLVMRSTRQEVYNFTVEDLHCYAVGSGEVLVHNTAVGCAGAGRSGWEEPEPAARSAEATPELARTIADVESIPLRFKRTVCVLETERGPILVAGGASDLSANQELEAMERGLTPVPPMPGADAEITVLQGAAQMGLRARRGVTTNNICPHCADFIESIGGRLTGSRSFEF